MNQPEDAAQERTAVAGPVAGGEPVPPPIPGADAGDARRRAFLLYQLVDAGGRTKAGVLNRKMTRGAQKALGLTGAVANQLRAQLGREGVLEGAWRSRRCSMRGRTAGGGTCAGWSGRRCRGGG